MQSTILDNGQSKNSTIRIGDLAIASVSIEEAARDMVDYCRSPARKQSERPVYSTSVNGQVISMCWGAPNVKTSFQQADIIHCDGQPLVMLSRLLARRPFPERVATTDLFPVTAHMCADAGLSIYMLGASEEANRAAVAAVRKQHPTLRISGARNGYFSRAEEPEIIAEIAALKPDILWVALGAPAEQEFCLRNLSELKGVGVVKTSGGLFDFVSRKKKRAPQWMQRFGLEWLFRLALEPRRLFMRYFLTNPHAFYILLRNMR